MYVCCECCVLSGRGLCDELITRPEESYRLWCVVVCDLETSWMRKPWPTGGHRAKTNKLSHKRFFLPKLCVLRIKSLQHTWLMTVQCVVEATDCEALNYDVVCVLLYFLLLGYKYSPQHLHRTSSNIRNNVWFGDLYIFIYLLQLGCHPVAVDILHVYKIWNWLLLDISLEGYMRSM